MPDIIFQPGGKKAHVRPGTSLLMASRKARAIIPTRCGGHAACLMCKVQVFDQKHLTPPGLHEQLKLGSLLEDHYRLSCQAKAIGGPVEAHIPENSLKLAVKALLEKQKKEREDDLW